MQYIIAFTLTNLDDAPPVSRHGLHTDLFKLRGHLPSNLKTMGDEWIASIMTTVLSATHHRLGELSLHDA